MVQLVNGYPCRNAADAALARRGIDPTANSTAADSARSSAPVDKAKSSGAAADLGRVGRGRFVDLIA